MTKAAKCVCRRCGVRDAPGFMLAVLFSLVMAIPRPVDAEPPLQSFLGGAADGFETVTGPRPFSFPADHGAHPRYRVEWWYVTGVVTTSDARRVGFQLTLFRFGLRPPSQSMKRASEPESTWRARSAWLAHFGLTDVRNERFVSRERFARGGSIGLAGARTDPFRVWVENWSIESAGDSFWPLRIVASDGDERLDLQVDTIKPPVLQGEAGYSRKSAGPGNASHYYSLTRLRGQGTVTVGGETVSGEVSAWLDREWSTSALGPDQAGWDWFSLQLEDGRDVMVYRLRRVDGSQDPFSAGVVVAPDGHASPLDSTAFTLTPTRWFQIDEGNRYPVAWRVEVPAHALDLTVGAVLDQQHHEGLIPYWEGLVDARDASGRAVGSGYLEMTGYVRR
ncbi:MAG: lipocalin-like domain-containing protein [Pseudomonadota bacterium]